MVGWCALRVDFGDERVDTLIWKLMSKKEKRVDTLILKLISKTEERKNKLRCDPSPPSSL